MNPKLDGRYLIVASACVIQAVMIGSMFAYGVFFKALETELGWSRTLLAGSSSLSFLVMGALAIVAGRLNDRYGPRWVLSVAGICFGLGFALMSRMNAPWQLFVLFGLLVGIGLSTHDVVTLSTVARWFDRRRGMMSGVVKVGTACGQIVIPLAASLLIVHFGWRNACLVLGCCALILLLLAAQGLRRDPGVAGASGASPASRKPETGLSLRQAAATRPFWILCVAQFLFFPSLITIPVHIVAHGMDLGLAAAVAAGLVSTIGASSILGRLFVGAAADRIGGRNAMRVCFAVLLVSLLSLRAIETPSALFLFAACYGFAHGGLFTVVSPTVAEYFGMAAHGAIFGVILCFGTVGGALGPLLAGYIFDSGGSYLPAFTGLSVLAGIGLLLLLALRPPPTASATVLATAGPG